MLGYLFNDAKSMPRLVLLDLALPEMDGLKVLRRIREHERTRRVPVVILTGFNARKMSLRRIDLAAHLEPRHLVVAAEQLTLAA